MSRDPSRYIIDGVRYPSVTEILKMGGWIDFARVDPTILSRAADRGTYVHEASELIDDDDLDWDSVPKPWVGYCRAYEAFRSKTNLVIEGSEENVTNRDHRYCGQLDRRGRLDGKPAIIDIKTSYRPSDVWGIQIAGYAACFDGDYDRLALWLRRDGTFRLIRYDDPADTDLFLSTVKVVHGLIDKGLLRPEWETAA